MTTLTPELTIDAGPRQTGRTTRLLHWLAETPDAVLFEPDAHAAEHVRRMADGIPGLYHRDRDRIVALGRSGRPVLGSTSGFRRAGLDDGQEVVARLLRFHLGLPVERLSLHTPHPGIAQVLELHTSTELPGGSRCRCCKDRYPCATVRALTHNV